MFGIGPIEIAVILIFALVFVGPKKLPELARQFGRFFVQMKRMTSDVRNTFDDYVKKAEQEILAEDREKIRSLLNKDLMQPLKTLDAEIKAGVNSALSDPPDHHHHHHHDESPTHLPEAPQSPDGTKNTARPSSATGTPDWDKPTS